MTSSQLICFVVGFIQRVAYIFACGLHGKINWGARVMTLQFLQEMKSLAFLAAVSGCLRSSFFVAPCVSMFSPLHCPLVVVMVVRSAACCAAVSCRFIQVASNFFYMRGGGRTWCCAPIPLWIWCCTSTSSLQEGRYGLVDKTHPSCVRPGFNTRVQH